MIVIQHIQHKYACQHCNQQVVLANKPNSILPKTNAWPGLLAHIATTKYVDAVPLNRQENQFDRLGVNVPRQRMARWLIKLSMKAIVLLNLFEDHIREGPWIQCDETPFKVLKELGRKASSLSYMWVRRGDCGKMYVFLRNLVKNELFSRHSSVDKINNVHIKPIADRFYMYYPMLQYRIDDEG